MIHRLRPLLLSLPLFAAWPALAEEAALLEDPPNIIGVAPTPLGGIAVTLGGGFTTARSGPHRTTYVGAAQIEAGVLDGADLRITTEAAYGRAAPFPSEANIPSWGGGTQVGLRWQFLEEEGSLRPALGLWGGINTFYGRSRPAEDAEVLLLASKTLRDGPLPIAAYLNLGGTFRLNPEPGERPGRYNVVGGLAAAVGQDTSVGVTYSLLQQDRTELEQQLILGGIWHRLGNGGPILGLVAGPGLGRDSPSFLVAVTAKWLFGAAAE